MARPRIDLWEASDIIRIQNPDAMANILIIDDDRLVRDSLRQVVEKMDHTATVAASVAEALELFPNGSFDLVFCDVRMPDGSGLDVLPKIRAADPAPEVIIITGYGDPDGASWPFRRLGLCRSPVRPGRDAVRGRPRYQRGVRRRGRSP
jgi:two-component system NtrC family response regulator